MSFIPKNKIITVEDEMLIVSLYKKGLPASEILQELKNKFKTRKTIYDVLKKYGVDTKTKSDYTKINHTYFSNIDTANKAYILGLLLTDGWVHQKKNSGSFQIGIGLKKEDRYIIEKIKKEWESNNKIIEIEPKIVQVSKNSKKYLGTGMAQLIVSSTKMAEDLKGFNIQPCKTQITTLPILAQEELQSHLLRGILDGDGTLYLHSNKENIVIGFLGSHYLVAQISLYLKLVLNVTQANPRKVSSIDTISKIEWASKEEVKKILNYIYKNIDEETMFLIRKKEIVKDYL